MTKFRNKQGVIPLENFENDIPFEEIDVSKDPAKEWLNERIKRAKEETRKKEKDT